MSLLDITKKTAKERGLSLTDVATKAGIVQKSIYQWKSIEKVVQRQLDVIYLFQNI